jgi:hypothetical protein
MSKRGKIASASVAILLAMAGVFASRLAAAKRRAQSQSCVGRMTAINLAGRLYASDNGGHFPSNFISMSNELVTPKVLHCSGENGHVWATNWESFTDLNCSYEMVTPGAREDATNTVFIRCRVHGIRGFVDGTILDGTQKRHKFE